MVHITQKVVDTKGIIRNHKSKRNRQYSGQKKNYRMTNDDGTKYYTENKRSSNQEPTKYMVNEEYENYHLLTKQNRS